MFALEIAFQDGLSQTMMILVRRPQALIGASEEAHVDIEDMKDLNYQLRLTKCVGRKFRCKLETLDKVNLNDINAIPEIPHGAINGSTSLKLANLQLTVTSLDPDLAVKAGEPPDRAGVRILRQACALDTPEFPAVVVAGASPIVVSFSPDQPAYIGRSNKCAVRLDGADISGKHARIGFEEGRFWIEDLGSTNGTFVHNQQISGRVNVEPNVPIFLGGQTSIYGVVSQDGLEKIINKEVEKVAPQQSLQRYPILLSMSEVARPARLVLPVDGSVTIGREPSSDLWLGAPHVSRRHCTISLSQTGITTVEDSSTNGTVYDGGILKKGHTLELDGEAKVLNFGGNLTVAICFNKEQEEKFKNANGSADAFVENEVKVEKTKKQVGLTESFMEETSLQPPQMQRARVSKNTVESMLNTGRGFVKTEDLERYFSSLSLPKKVLFIFIMILLNALIIFSLFILCGAIF